MKTRIILLFSIVMFSVNLTKAQTNINDYKYVVVPTTFDFFTKPDLYRLNTLTKLLLEKHGFIALMEDEILPDEAISNNCLVLKADVLNYTGTFYSKLQVQLKDCKNNIVFISSIGKSREKINQVSYTLALREAFRSFNAIKYKYKENPAILAYALADIQNNTEIEKLKEEIKTLKEEKEEKEIPQKEVIEKELIVEEKSLVIDKEDDNNNLDTLHSKKTTNGFLLIDNTSKVLYKIKKTGMTNVYLVEGEDAIIYQLNTNWVLEYYENDALKTKTLKINF